MSSEVAIEKERTKRHSALWAFAKYALATIVGAGGATGISMKYHKETAPQMVPMSEVLVAIRAEITPIAEEVARLKTDTLEAKAIAITARTDSAYLKQRLDNEMVKLSDTMTIVRETVARIDERTKKGGT